MDRSHWRKCNSLVAGLHHGAGRVTFPDITERARLSPATHLFAALPLSDLVKEDLARRMTGPLRHYHGLAHLELLWARHRRYAPDSGLRVALRQRGDNYEAEPAASLVPLLRALTYSRLRVQRRPSRRLSNTLTRHH